MNCAKCLSYNLACNLAITANCKEVLKQLSKNRSPVVRAIVAQSLYTDPLILEYLSQDKNETVIDEISYNPNSNNVALDFAVKFYFRDIHNVKLEHLYHAMNLTDHENCSIDTIKYLTNIKFETNKAIIFGKLFAKFQDKMLAKLAKLKGLESFI